MKWLIILIIILSSSEAFAQKIKRDTIYYFLETIEAPSASADCVWDSGVEGPFKYYHFRCSFLNNKQSVFIHNLNENGVLIRKLPVHLVPLNKLIESLNTDSGLMFNKKHVTFFIEPSRDKYIEHQVRLLNPARRDPITDAVKMKADTNHK